jgi:hypothetical protein
MSQKLHLIQSYLVRIPDGQDYPTITLILEQKDPPPEGSMRYRCAINFSDAPDLPPTVEAPTNAGYSVYIARFRPDRYRDLIDLLRNERPVYCRWDGERIHIETLFEPVGSND